MSFKALTVVFCVVMNFLNKSVKFVIKRIKTKNFSVVMLKSVVA